MKITITGYKGYIGQKLLENVKFSDVTLELIDLKDGVDALYYNGESDVIIHLAAQAGVVPSQKDPINDARQNILVTLNMIRSANRNNARLVFVTSGAAVEPESPYGLSKQTCERYIKMLCTNYVILRLSSVYGGKPKGVVDNFIRDDKCVIYGDGSAVRDFVHVDDVVNGIWHSLNWEVGSYDMGSGKGTSVKEIAQATKKPIEFLKARHGEKQEVILQNTTPDWSPVIDVIDYVRSKGG